MSDRFSETQLRSLMDARASGSVPWLAGLREEARTKFPGLPTRRVEAWKYSDLSRALDDKTSGERGENPLLLLPGAALAVFENGVLRETGAAILPLRRVLADPMSPFADILGRVNPQPGHALVQLNTALMEDGLILYLPRGTRPDAPVQLRFSWTGEDESAGHHLRILVVLEEGAEATLVETHEGAPDFTSIVTEVKLGARARLTHVRLEQLGASARQAAVTVGELAPSSAYRGFYLSEGGYFSRHEALLKLAGEGAEAHIDAAYLVGDERHCDNTTVITHAAPHTTSRQSFRGVLSGQARGVYQGCVSVRPGAQGTDARQMSRALLLSRKAEAVTKPELEILNDDVKCSHGATAGEIDHAALFFLRARGIPEAEARSLLVGAFLGEALDAIENEAQRALASDAVQRWLDRHAGEVSHVE